MPTKRKGAAAEDKSEVQPAKKTKEKSMDYSKFYRRIVSPTTWYNISEQIGALQDGLECDDFNLYGWREEIRVLANYIDLLLKMFNLIQHMEDLTSKGMTSDKQ